MKYFNVFIFVAFISFLSLVCSKESEVLLKWEAFKQEYKKSYSSLEEKKRFEIFTSNLKIAEELNQRDKYAEYGVTKFSDLSPEEFRSLYLMNMTSALPITAPLLQSPPNITLPPNFNWISLGAVTGVKNQVNLLKIDDF